MDFNEEDNNPFLGTSHLFASGISNLNEGYNNGNSNTINHYHGFNDGFMTINNQFLNTSANVMNDTGAGVSGPLSITGSSRYTYGPAMSSGIHEDEDQVEEDEQINQANHMNQIEEGEVATGEEDEVQTSISDATYHPNLNSTRDDSLFQTAPLITITDAGHVRDSKGNKAIAYNIIYDGMEIKRRYSEFDSLRTNLLRLFPTTIIPSIPEKHSIVKYFINPLNAKNDMKIIEKRKRLFSRFLEKCLAIPQVSSCFIFKQFLTPEVVWSEVLANPPISILPSSNLLAPPLNPTKPSPLHLLLPVPSSTNINGFRPRDEDKALEKEFHDYKRLFKVYKNCTGELIANVKKQKRHFKGMIKDFGELGAYYNAFSLEDKVMELSLAIEKTGHAIDINYLNSEAFNFKILTILEEPIIEIHNNSSECLNVLHFRTLKTVQLFIIDTTIKRRTTRLENLRNAKQSAAKLEQILKKNAEQSPTIAAAVRRLENGESLKTMSTWQKFLKNSGNSSGNYDDDIANMSDIERNIEMEKIEKDLVKLNDCLKIILKDIAQINESIKNNIEDLLMYYNQQWKEILKNYSKSILIWLKANLQTWEDAKAEIDRIDMKKPDELS